MVLDVLRGMAMFGVLFVNLMVFTGDAGAGFAVTRLDRGVNFVRDTALNGKCYPILAMVFGYSQALQMHLAGTVRQRRRALTKRLIALAALGLLHGVLLYRFDILFAYGVLGYLAYCLRNRSTRFLSVLFGAMVVCGSWALLTPIDTRGLARYGTTVAVERYRSGTLTQLVEVHVHNYFANITGEMFLQWPFAFAAILIGLLAERYDLIRTIRFYPRILRAVQIVGGLSVVIIIASSLPFDLINPDLLGKLTPASSFGFDLGIVTLFATRMRVNSFVARGFAYVGRMSLTVYLTQSVVCTTILYGYGFGLAYRFSPTVQAVFSVGFFALQALGCRWWLRSHRRGPVELLMRKFASPEPLFKRPSPTLNLQPDRNLQPELSGAQAEH